MCVWLDRRKSGGMKNSFVWLRGKGQKSSKYMNIGWGSFVQSMSKCSHSSFPPELGGLNFYGPREKTSRPCGRKGKKCRSCHLVI